MNVYHLESSKRMWDADVEYFVAADTAEEALSILHNGFREEVELRDYRRAAGPEAAKQAALDWLAYIIEAFSTVELFAIALPNTEKGIIHSVYAAG